VISLIINIIKMSFKTNRLLYLIFSAVVIVLATSSIIIFSQADSINTSVKIANSLPEIQTVITSDIAFGEEYYTEGNIMPNVGSSTDIHITGIVYDNNSADDIATVTLIFFRSGIIGTSTCTADNNNCYQNLTNCTFTPNANPNALNYNCSLSLKYYIDSTDTSGHYPDDEWIIYLRAYDNSGEYTENYAHSREIMGTLSLNIPSSIHYGSLANGEMTTASTNVEMIISQNGNSAADITVQGQDMVCDTGTISVDYQKWATTDIGYDNASSTSLTASETRAYLGIGFHEDDLSTSTSDSLYWNISIPSGVRGTCHGNTTILVVIDEGLFPAYLIDSPVAGINYTASPSGLSGTTNTEGKFYYRENDIISFYINQIELGFVAAENINDFVFPGQLAGLDNAETMNPKVVNLARFLQSVDEDNNPENGIKISNTCPNIASNIQDLSPSELEILITNCNKTPVVESNAVIHLEESLAKANISKKSNGEECNNDNECLSNKCENNICIENILFGTYPENISQTIFLANGGDGLRAYEYNGETLIPAGHINDGGSFNNIAITSNKTIIIGKKNEGLYAYNYDKENKTFISVGSIKEGVSYNDVKDIGIMSDDTIITANYKNGIRAYQHDGTNFIPAGYKDDMTRYNYAADLTITSDDVIILGTWNDGLYAYLYDSNTKSFVKRKTSDPGGNTMQVSITNEDTIMYAAYITGFFSYTYDKASNIFTEKTNLDIKGARKIGIIDNNLILLYKNYSGDVSNKIYNYTNNAFSLNQDLADTSSIINSKTLNNDTLFICKGNLGLFVYDRNNNFAEITNINDGGSAMDIAFE